MDPLYKRLNYGSMMAEYRRLLRRPELLGLEEKYDLKNAVVYQTTGRSLNGYPAKEISNIPLNPAKKYIFRNNVKYNVVECRFFNNKGKSINDGTFLMFADDVVNKETLVVLKSSHTYDNSVKYTFNGTYSVYGPKRLWQQIGTSEMFHESEDPCCAFDYDNARKNAFTRMQKLGRV